MVTSDINGYVKNVIDGDLAWLGCNGLDTPSKIEETNANESKIKC